VRVGSSVRGSIDLVRVASSLATARSADVTEWAVGLDAAFVALSGRIRLSESAGRTPEQIVRELYEGVFGPPPSEESEPSAGDSPGEAAARPARAPSH
jgi:MoxR-like ATPase